MTKRPGEHLKFRMRECLRLFRHREPWKTEAELYALINATVGDPIKYNADEIGEKIELKLEERALLNIKTMAAYNATEDERLAFYAERRQERDRIRKQRHREKKNDVPPKTRVRMQREKLRAFLKGASKANQVRWLTVQEIADGVGRSKAFRGLKPASLRTTIHHAIDTLVDQDQIEVGFIGQWNSCFFLGDIYSVADWHWRFEFG